MTYDFGETWLWRKALVEPRNDCAPAEQAFFLQHLKNMRERIEPLAARIMRDMPGYTVHDVTHLDALWQTASLVASPGLELNPPEAFVFGGAVLLHDAAMTLAAYPRGLADLKGTAEWNDVMALNKDVLTNKASHAGDLQLETQVTVEVLRRLHGRQAAELAIQGWALKGGTDEPVYLIENTDLRRFYGPTIGIVAHSHWWPIAKVGRELSRSLGGMTPQTQLKVDLLKIACLLRVADALHLDRRRAPPFVRAG